VIYEDHEQNVFYVKNTGGARTACREHRGHIRVAPEMIKKISTSLPDSVLDLIAHSTAAYVPCGATRSLVQIREQERITQSQIAYLKKLKKQSTIDGSDEINNLIGSLQSMEGVDYGVLFHEWNQDTVLLTEYEDRRNKKSRFLCDVFTGTSPYPCTIDHIVNTGADGSSAKAEVSALRESLKIPDTDRLFLGLAWVTRREKLLFTQFPEVCFSDTTMGTNSKKSPSLS
jgi:hypothetical protein